MASTRSVRVDLLKCIAILAVIFYHLGFLQYGYLGVDIFLVISGYFLGRGLVKPRNGEKFAFFPFLMQRLMRLWPLILLAAAVSLAVGFFFMLPVDYENLAQSTIASCFFANNILPAITLKNYWAVINEFKPLMHTWYVGVLLQSYVVFALIAKVAHRFTKDPNKTCRISFLVVLVFSLALYLLPVMKEHEKFYYIPARLFELACGALLAAIAPERVEKLSQIFRKHKLSLPAQLLSLGALLLLVALPVDFLPANVRLLSVNAMTLFLLFLFVADTRDWNIPVVTQLSFVGKASFSFFVWHQVVIAFVKYAWHSPLGFTEACASLLLTFLISTFSYFLVENKLDRLLRDSKKRRFCTLLCVVLCLLVSSASFLVFRRAGVVRDVPELGIYTSNIIPDLHADYCDRIYDYNKAFTDTDKVRVLVLGNSFGRDFANVLLESDYGDDIELSYATSADQAGQGRIAEADYVFYAIYGNDFKGLPSLLTTEGTMEKLYLIGFKNYGSSNGNFYSRRFSDHYLEQSVTLTEDFFRQNDALRERFGEAYIDMLTPVQKEDGSIRVFTDEGKFISPDCHHLTVYGAKYYAEVLDLNAIFG